MCGALLIGACTNIDTGHELPSPSDFNKPLEVIEKNISLITEQQANSFSTSGKPTKLYSTANGPIRVYDIAQDADVLQAIEEVYKKGDITFGDVSFKAYDVDHHIFFSPNIEVTPAAMLLTKARQISYYDLYRSSCKIVERAPCGDGKSGWGPRYVSDCPTCNLGKAPDHSVEQIRFNYNRVVEKFLTNDEKARGRWPALQNGEAPTTAYLDECRDISKQPLLKYYYIGERSGYSLQEAKELLLYHNCSEW